MKVILCNCPVEKAREIATVLVERRLAACVNLLPTVQSLYLWEGKLCDEPEVPLLIKTSEATAPILVDALKALHPYELPEILALEISSTGSSSTYIKWVQGSCQNITPKPTLK